MWYRSRTAPEDAMNEVTPSWLSDVLIALLMVIAVVGILVRHRRKSKLQSH
jgi:hypothetical protein